MPIKIPSTIEAQRITLGPLASPKGARYGCFCVGYKNGVYLTVIVSNGTDIPTIAPNGTTIIWEHVSVSVTPDGRVARCPTWEEMDFIRNAFWDPEDIVVQFHPPASMKVNVHHYTLHMWRGIGLSIFLPPKAFV